MAKKITLNDIAGMLTKQGTEIKGLGNKIKGLTEIVSKHGKEIKDLTESVSYVVKRMATKEDITELKGSIARVQKQVNSIETELKYGRYETRLGKLEDKVFGTSHR